MRTPWPTETPYPTGLTAGEMEMIAHAKADVTLLVLVVMFLMALLFGVLMWAIVGD